jgi:DNA replication licensing factor MCM7
VDFLKNFKSSSTEAAEQLEGLNLNGEGDGDEYDMVDDSDDPAPGDAQRRHNKLKYMQLLQGVADRTQTEILIDLNDLEAVSLVQRTVGPFG